MIQKTYIKILTAILIVTFPLQALAQAQSVDPAFNPNKIIDDSVFVDTQTFGGAEGIQKFLESKNSVLARTSPDFLQKLKEPTITLLKQALDDPRPNLGRLRTAAEIIWDASQSSGLNPQVIIVKLQKEQSLITGHTEDSPERLQRALDFSLGFGCPDSTGCKDSLYPGFYFQLFGNLDTGGNRYVGAAKSLMKSFNTEGGRGPSVNGKIAKVGDVITLDNTMGGYEGILPQQSIQIANKSTAALYRYTPHIYNGNYNFWKFFNEWFRYPNGTLVKLTGDANLYVIQNGYRQLVPGFVAQARKFDTTKTVAVSPNEIQSYPQGKLLGPEDNTVVKVDGDTHTYVFINNTKRPASSFVLTQRGLTDTNALTMTAAESQLFEQGQVLTPNDGSILRGEKKPEIYLVQNGSLQLFSAYTFAQRKVSKEVKVVPDSEIDTYPKFGFVSPLDGTLVKSAKQNTVYYMEGGLKKPVSGPVFKNRGFKNAQVVVLSEEEVSGLPIGAFATPKERTVVKAPDGSLYLFKDGQKHLVSTFVSKQRKITADISVTTQEAGEWADGVPIPPADNTVVKGDKSQAVYIVQKSQLRPLTAAAYKARKITAKKITVLPQAEVDNYAKGDTLTK